MKNKLLLHICCSPCLMYPYTVVNKKFDNVIGYFYNPNIHPYSEYLRREESLRKFAVSLLARSEEISSAARPEISSAACSEKHAFSAVEDAFSAAEDAFSASGNAACFKVIYEKNYDMEEFIRNVAFREENRCYYCLGKRLEKTASLARSSKFTHFSTTLLYSKHQKHDYIKEVGFNLQKKYGVNFYYEDFRAGYKEGIKLSYEYNLYRQNYCGCIYSEKERFYKQK
ncbi:MAG: epoxyqueuosine reductase QueH [bacterium]